MLMTLAGDSVDMKARSGGGGPFYPAACIRVNLASPIGIHSIRLWSDLKDEADLPFHDASDA